ncbi:MAG: hypothetical protein COA50_12820 [Flavobacteriaceae bacterium]|nr:MAG: hypothetical protein COA50_12820 [Flavobacteriaceae bacterium]
MLRYTISLLFILCFCLGNSQSKSVNLQQKDTVLYKQKYGIRAGIDLSKLLITNLNDDYTGLEVVGDYRLTENLYLAAELGNEKRTKQEDLYNFTTSGSYIKLGVDYNTYENWLGMNNSIYIGGRYALSSFSQTLNNYQIYDTNRYWSPDDFVTGATSNEEFSGLNASWLEFVLGIKAELFANIYLGGSVRLGYLISDKPSDKFPNLWIPGFNRITDNSNFGLGYNYSLTYFLPLYKKAKKKKEKASVNQ